MPGPKIFPSITPEHSAADKASDEIPEYWRMDWNQLRSWATTREGVNGKATREEILLQLDEYYDIEKGKEQIERENDGD